MLAAGKAAGLATALVLVAACGGKKTSSAEDANSDVVEPVSIDAALPPNPGLVYLGVSREGVVELIGGSFRRVIPSQGRIDDLAVTPNGDVYAIADAQILRSKKGASEDQAELVGNRSAPGIARKIAAASDGSVWAITGKGLWRRTNDEWAADETFPRPRTVVDIVSSRGGRVVAAARDAAFVLESDGWREVSLPDPPVEPKPKTTPDAGYGVGDSGDDGVDEEGSSKKQIFLRELVVGADDLIYASTSSGVYLLGDTDWRRVTKVSVGAFAVGADGNLVAEAESGALLWGQKDSLAERELGSLGLAATELDGVATDSLSRVWLATDGGLILANHRGEAKRIWSSGSLAALSGRIAKIEVVDAPTILPKIAERRIGAIAGTLVSPSSKVANVEVEICARPDTMFRGSPCAEATYKGRATTDDKGKFRIDGVPAGRYGFAVKKGDEWIVDLTIDCCAQLFSSDEHTVNKIRVE